MNIDEQVVLDSMPEHDVLEAVRVLYERDERRVLVILTDGTALAGSLPWRVTQVFPLERAIPAEEQCFENGQLKLEYHRPFNEHTVLVPMHRVAGIEPFAYSQGTITVPWEDDRRSLEDHLFEDSARKAVVEQLPVERVHTMYQLGPTQQLEWGDVRFRYDTPLYADWSYFQQKAGGLRSLGAGFIVSGSMGWSKSLWSSFTKALKGKPVPIFGACQHQVVMVQGFVSFFNLSDDDLRPLLEQSMEGGRWSPALVTKQRIADGKVAAAGPWMVGLFREESLMFPRGQWDAVAQPVRVFGEIYPVQVKTQYGYGGCFVKVRGAGFRRPKG